MKLLTAVLPGWARLAALVAAIAVVFLLGQLHGERLAGQRHIDYVSKQATETVRIVQARAKVVVRTEIKYRDRIQKIYVQGDQIAEQVPAFITPSDNDRCIVNTGFVRLHDAAWTGSAPGPAADFDRDPAGISLAQVGETDAFNATACRAWRELALGLGEFYDKLKAETAAAAEGQ